MLLDEQLPRLQKLIKEKLGPLPKDIFRNETVMRTTFRQLYRRLPRVMSLAVGEEGFVEFCMRNHARLLNVKDAVAEQWQGEAVVAASARTPAETEALAESARQRWIPTYAPKTMILARGQGSRVWDIEGNEYLDLGGGIAVSSLGHQDPELLEALHAQAGKLWHTSNLYYTEPAIRLAEDLTAHSFADRVFFCNSGAEANEAAIKLARKHASKNHPPEKREILSFTGSFHGRTLATVTATAQPKYQEGYEPLPGGFCYCPFNDFDAASEMIGPQTCAVLVEPIQGEGGVTPAAPGFLKHLRERCDEHGALLVLDEIQCGMGRTGKLFAHQWEEGVTPDLLTIAKALGCGLPIGALLATEAVASAFQAGDHGTTFGGNPITTSVAGAAFRRLRDPELHAHVLRQGEALRNWLEELNLELGFLQEVRGRGLMLAGVLREELAGKAGELMEAARQAGVLILVAGPGVLRFVPPLTLTDEELQVACDRLGPALREWCRSAAAA